MAAAVNLAESVQESTAAVEDVPAPPEVETEGPVEKRRRAPQGRTTQVHMFREGSLDDHVPLDRIPALVRDDANLAWIDLSEYPRADFQHVADLLGLHPLTVRATLADWERPRVDVFPAYFYMSVTVVDADQARRKLVARELNIVVARNFLITAHKSSMPFTEKIRDRLRQSPEVATLHTAYGLYIVLGELLEHYAGLFEHIDEEIERVEEAALTETSDRFLEDLLALKRYIFVLSRFAEQHRSVFAVLTRPDFTHVSGERIEPYFKDLQEDLARLIDRLSAARESVTDAFDIYVSQVSHRTSQLLRVLTLISTVVLPATLVVSFFATSFTWTHALYSFPAFLVMLLLAIGLPTGILLFIRARKLV
ncbi:MAG: magnesium transporter CorA family protein [Candidatus Dormibacteria bacterium]